MSIKIIFALLQMGVTYVSAPIFKTFRKSEEVLELKAATEENLERLQVELCDKKEKQNAITIEEVKDNSVSVEYLNALINFISARINEVSVGQEVYLKFAQVHNSWDNINDAQFQKFALEELGSIADIIVEASQENLTLMQSSDYARF